MMLNLKPIKARLEDPSRAYLEQDRMDLEELVEEVERLREVMRDIARSVDKVMDTCLSSGDDKAMDHWMRLRSVADGELDRIIGQHDD